MFWFLYARLWKFYLYLYFVILYSNKICFWFSVSKLEEKLNKTERQYKDAVDQTVAKVDKQLVRNLIVGFVSANTSTLNKDQYQILKLIASVLDFDQKDQEKLNINKQEQVSSSSWLGSLLQQRTSGEIQRVNNESVLQAFMKFVEEESQPRQQLPSLLDNTGELLQALGDRNGISSQSSNLLNEVVLPSFADYGQSRNSSSILKHVLKDSS